jgi:hypothetical protein
MSACRHENASKPWLPGSTEDFVLSVPLSATMSDRFATIVIFALIGSACFVIAAAPHLTAYSALVTWAAKLIT